jgi:hypothetical protein
MNVWVIKCTDRRADRAAWHWRSYFHGLDDGARTAVPYRFGGDAWIRHRASRQRIRDEIATADLVVCYYTKRREVLGLTRLSSSGREEHEGSGRFTVFDLAPADEAIAFDPPLRVVEDLYRKGIRPLCFGPGTHGTLFAVRHRDFASIVNVILRRSAGSADALREWLARAGWQQRTGRAARDMERRR